MQPQTRFPDCPGRAVPVTRRQMLREGGQGFAWLALSAMLSRRAAARSASPPKPHFAPRAKRVIFCFMEGGVSHVDTFDPKPTLTRLNGQPTQISKQVNPTTTGTRQWLGSPWRFQQRGECGMAVSELFPHVAKYVDELSLIRSFQGESPLHPQGSMLVHQGRTTGGLPSLGSWVSYGLGSENQNLPGYVLLTNNWMANGGQQIFSNAFLPARHQPTRLRASGIAIDNIAPHDEPGLQRRKLALIQQQNAAFAANRGSDDALETVVRNYQIAYRMQSLMPDVLDLNQETKSTLDLYGVGVKNEKQHFYATQCLRARRLVEAGVRFVEITCPLTFSSNSPWDQHSQLRAGHQANAQITDQAIAGLIRDLKQRGLLEDTLIVWAGEMGRTPHAAKGRHDGRDHHIDCYSIWLAGGGTRGGAIYGASDELGMRVAEDPVSVHDLHATVLHLLGLDHEQLIYRFGGRDHRLTDVHGRVLSDLLV